MAIKNKVLRPRPCFLQERFNEKNNEAKQFGEG